MGKRVCGVVLAMVLVFAVSACSGADSDEGGAPGSKAPEASATSQPEVETEASEEPEASGVLTVETSKDLAELLSGPTVGPGVEAFVDDHHLEPIVLDGYVTFVIDSEKAVYSTADFVAGDSGGPTPTGPIFQFSPVLLPATSPLQSADLEVGMNVRVTGVVGSYYSFEESTTFLPERDTRVILVVDSVEAR